MKRFTSWLFWFSIATALIPSIYFFYHLDDKQFLDSAMGNWFATIVGVIIGIPIALEINRRQQSEQEKREELSQAEERAKRKYKVLTLIREELRFNQQILDQLIEQQKTHPGIRAITGLKDALWSALSNSGDLQWVDELDLLSSISNSYHMISALIHLERQYADPSFLMAVSRVNGTGPTYKYAGEKTVEVVISIRPDALAMIQQTINAIDEYLARDIQDSEKFN